MIHSFIIKIVSVIASFGLLFTPVAATSYGSVNPVGGTQYSLAGAGINSTQNTIPLASFTTPDGRPLTMTMFGTVGYGALEPQTTAKLEDITFSGIVQNVNGTATLTGVTRGNDFVTPYAASTTLAHSHAGGATFILTNTAGFYAQFASVNNAQTITGVWTFGSTTPPRYDADPVWANFSTQVFADVSYVNSVVAAGAANASETVKGIIQLATGAQSAAGTSSGSTGARLVVPNSLATSTPYSGTPQGSFPTSNATGGKISQLWLDLTQSFTFSGGLVSTLATTIAASDTSTHALTLNGLAYQWPASQTANAVLTTNGSGVLTWTQPSPTVYLQDSTLYATTGSGATTSIATYAIPASTIGINGSLDVTAYLVPTNQVSAPTVTCIQANFGDGTATTTLGYSCSTSSNPLTPTGMKAGVRNINSASSQSLYSMPLGPNSLGGSVATSAVNTAVKFYVNFLGKAASSNTDNLEGVTIYKTP